MYVHRSETIHNPYQNNLSPLAIGTMLSPSILEHNNTKHALLFQINAADKDHRTILRMQDQEKALPDHAGSVSYIRRKVARDLEPLVSKHFLGANCSGFFIKDTKNGITLSARKKIGLISRVIEAKLYRSSHSLTQHADPETLAEKFNALMARSTLMQERALMDSKKFNAENLGSTRNDYQLLLRMYVGGSLYDQIQEASCKLRLLRVECVNLRLGRGMNIHTLEPNVEEQLVEDMVPHALRKLYFNCRLLKSLGALNVHTKAVEMKRVTLPDWKDLLHEARTLIDEIEYLRALFNSDSVPCCCSNAKM